MVIYTTGFFWEPISTYIVNDSLLVFNISCKVTSDFVCNYMVDVGVFIVISRTTIPDEMISKTEHTLSPVLCRSE